MNTTLLKKIFGILLSCAIGVVFIFSAISKIPSLEPFGWAIVETTFLNWTAAEWFARILIGIELMVGIFFLLNIYLKKFTIPCTTILLILFSCYLAWIIKTYGNNGNCGCLGEWIKMTPQHSIYKNFVLLLAIYLLYFIRFEFRFKYQSIVTGILIALCLFVPIYFNPPESIYINTEVNTKPTPVPLSILYQSATNKPPLQELRKGKHIVCFMSLTCAYCRKAAKRIKIMKDKHPELPFYFVLNGDSTLLNEFFIDTRATNIAYSQFNGADEFKKMAGNFLPSIYWMQDTIKVKESNYITLNESDILSWLMKK